MSVDLSVEIKTDRGTITLKNPIMPGASELAIDEGTVRKCIENDVGAVVTKSIFRQLPEMITNLSKPWAFPLEKYGPEYKGAWVLQAGVPSPENTPEKVVEKRLPAWKKMCRDAGVPLIVSILDVVPENWPYLAKLVEEGGADAIEMDASCPLAKVFYGKQKEPIVFSEEQWADLEVAKTIIRGVMKATTVPVGAKLSLFHNPVALHALTWESEGLNFISGHNALPNTGVFIDVEAEEVLGTPGQACYIAGPTMVPLSLSRLAHVLKVVKTPVIGVGGIYTAADAIQYLLLGCTAVQVCSAAYFKGHKVFKEIVEGLVDWMKRHGYTRIDQFRGKLLEDASCLKTEWEERYGYRLQPPEKGMLLHDLNPSPVVLRVNMETCTLCGICDQMCLYGAITIDYDKKVVNLDDTLCNGCGMCVGMCPENPGTFYLEDKRSGERVWDNVGMVSSFKKKSLGGYSLG
jgi:dihydroorotate dehydrogenase (NAD+) catalytic subunit